MRIVLHFYYLVRLREFSKNTILRVRSATKIILMNRTNCSICLSEIIAQKNSHVKNKKCLKSQRNRHSECAQFYVDNVDNVDKTHPHIVKREYRDVEKCVKNPHTNFEFYTIDMWIMWISYLPSSVSPISTTFPAPIVINKSPLIHFFNKNFSISSNEGK